MKKLLTLLLFSSIISTSFGQWQLIDDFEQWENEDYFYKAEDIGWHAVSADSDASREFWMGTDPYDSSSVTMSVNTGMADAGMKLNVVWVSKELPDGGILPGETGTLFFRFLFEGESGWHIGTADKELAYDSVTGEQIAPGAWGDFNALIRLGDEPAVSAPGAWGYFYK